LFNSLQYWRQVVSDPEDWEVSDEEREAAKRYDEMGDDYE
jgi:hypothetical protein